MTILPRNLIPKELWKQGVLHLPALLVRQYEDRLSDLRLIDTARAGIKKRDIHGGCSRDETFEHFAHRYGVSAGRMEFTALDPDDRLSDVSDALLNTFSEGRLALLDIPCGTGTATGALLSTLVALRTARVLPPLPLKVSVVGGDCSETALDICDSMLQEITRVASEQGIIVETHLRVWDATRGDETAALIDEWFARSAGADEFVVCVSNFSGALIKAGLLEHFEPCLEQILARLHDRKNTLVWIEPEYGDVQKKLIPRFFEFLRRRIPWLNQSTEEQRFLSAEYNISNPLNGKTHRSNVAVQRFERK